MLRNAMIEIRYSAPYDLDISGTVDELQMVRREILEFIQSDACEIAFDADSAINPVPYKHALSRLIILKEQGPTKVSLADGREMRVEGSPACLDVFAAFFNFESSAGKGSHYHYEYYEGHECIAPDSIPLVISMN
jgi:hypothetical protein